MIVCARLRLYQTGAWKGWLAIFLLVGVLLSMLLVPETRHELAVGTAALALITLGGWIKLSRAHVAAGAGE